LIFWVTFSLLHRLKRLLLWLYILAVVTQFTIIIFAAK
jgi:hypothetical protein